MMSQALGLAQFAATDNIPVSPYASRVDCSHLASVAAQLAPQLSDDMGTLVLIPTVGFGNQSHRVLPRTIQQLAAQRTSKPFTVVMLANRPEHRAPDGTEELIRQEISLHGKGGPSFAVANVVIAGRPQLGFLRQLLFDAVAVCRGGLPPDTAIIVADDDIVYAPPDTLETLVHALENSSGCDTVIGPVLFDDDQMPSALFVDFFVSDVLRALLAARWVERLSRPGPQWGTNHETIDLWQHYAEAIALSGNLALRSGALIDAGGFPLINEITGVVRRMQRHSFSRKTLSRVKDQATGVTGTWNFDPDRPDVIDSLLNVALRLSSRRALRAFATAGAPSVAQWRACRFHASRVDTARLEPQRLPRPMRLEQLGSAALKRLVSSTETLIATTLGFFPPDRDPARDALRAIGLDPRKCSAEPPEREGLPWHVSIIDPDVMLDRVLVAQRRLLNHG